MSKRTKARERDDDEEDFGRDDSVRRSTHWVPEAGIDPEVMAIYIRSFIDRDPKVKIGTYPGRPNENGYFVESVSAITREDIMAMIQDSRDFKREGRQGYYIDSSTWRTRKERGREEPTQGRPLAIVRPRGGAESSRPDTARTDSQTAARTSADDIQMTDRARQPSTVPTRPGSATQSQIQQQLAPQYESARAVNNQATTNYARSMQSPQYSSNYSSGQYQTYSLAENQAQNFAPPPRMSSNPRDDPNHPDNTGTQGFRRLIQAASPAPFDQAKPRTGQPDSTGTQGFRSQGQPQSESRNPNTSQPRRQNSAR